ncbi:MULTISPECIES: Fic family protein [unclassified Flavobacterium]|uniref:Fic family protein n=1 Tax=unclassified Flavobacterium TaxID=196869 RepID=UPI001F13698F|nr:MULTISPECIES: Fic family protein [unclassified Flavobacterium]UMY66440.1 Fic family protein [Flavobacterium sp. HJ-32-4]
MEELEEARLLKDELDGLRPIDAEQEARVMQKFRLDWNYHSNHLEGNSLTYGETRALLLFGVTAQGKPLKDTLEMTGHNEAVDWVIDMVKGERPLTESFIRELHTLLLKEAYEKKAETPDGQPTTKRIEVGKYKSSPNHVKTVTGEIFYFATPEETPAKMGDLMAWYQEKRNDDATNPVLLAAEFHYRFIRIHPFDDGNGRTARLLMNFILMQYGYPPVIIKTEDKENYFAVLRLADAGQLEPFVRYIGANLLRSLRIMIAGAKGEDITEPDDLDKEIALLEQQLAGFGEKIERTKSDSLRDVFEKSIRTVARDIENKLRPFFKYYRNPVVSISLGEHVYRLDELPDFDPDRLTEIRILVKLYDLDKKGLEHYHFNQELRFSLSDFAYTVYDGFDQRALFKKYYENLSSKEVSTLVSTVVTKHNEALKKALSTE